MINFNKGDYVCPKDPRYPLHCGTGLYEKAICVSVKPFVMVSEHGDMLWVKEKAEDYQFHSIPSSMATRKAFARWNNDNDHFHMD